MGRIVDAEAADCFEEAAGADREDLDAAAASDGEGLARRRDGGGVVIVGGSRRGCRSD